MTDPKDDNILSRWSRRKSAAREGNVDTSEGPENVAETGLNLADDGADSEAAKARAAELEANRKAAEAVDLTALDEKSDLSVFMKAGVPDLLRRQAMAALWRSNPVFANVDGLVDYGEDFANPGLIMKTFTSAWQAGRGYLKDDPPEEELASGAAADADRDENDPEAANSENADDTAQDISEEEVPVGGTVSDADQQFPAEDISGELAAEPEPAKRVSLRRRLMLDADG